MPGGERLGEGFLAHGDAAHVHGGQLFAQLVQQGRVGLTVHIAQHHVRAGALLELDTLQPQTAVPDAAAEQGGVLHQIFHKAVVTAPEDAAGVRLFDGAGGELLHVHQYAAGPAVHHQQRLAGEHTHDGLFTDVLHRGVAGGDVAGAEVLRAGDIPERGQRLPRGDDALQNSLLGVAVHHPQPGAAACDEQVAGRHVEAFAHAQLLIQRCGAGLKILLCHVSYLPA